jgi:hypothetical protein
VVDLSQWLVDDLDDITSRFHNQVQAQVPPPRRAEPHGGGTSILWNTFHIARHASLALSILTAQADEIRPAWLGALVADVGSVGAGLQEAAEPWSPVLTTAGVDGYLEDVLARANAYLTAGPIDFDAVPNTAEALKAARVDRDEFGWIYQTWSGKSAAWLVRWPVLGHSTSHLGEMLATRNRMGLSPF